ncbi:MAG TPA: hypothetical protein PKL77_08540 [Candidatus Omnitrophota bacterium]|nr:hypothetical protein [Candidatus Omnitrophota bacterium]
MSRLTNPDTNKVVYDTWELCELDNVCNRNCMEPTPCKIPKMIRRLAKLEDIICPENEQEITLERLAILCKAEREGRLVVLPKGGGSID